MTIELPELSFEGFDQEQAAKALHMAGEAIKPIIQQAAAAILVTVLIVATQAAAGNAKQLAGKTHGKLSG